MLADSFNSLIFCRFLTGNFNIFIILGIAIGGEYTIIFPIIIEFVPKLIRGRLVIILYSLWYIGHCLGILSLFLVQRGILPLKLILFIGIFAALPLSFIRKKIPESPR